MTKIYEATVKLEDDKLETIDGWTSYQIIGNMMVFFFEDPNVSVGYNTKNIVDFVTTEVE